MSLALATDGYYAPIGSGSGSADTTPPVVTAVSPMPGVEPGQPGGFPANFYAAKTTPVVVDAVDADPGVALIFVTDGGGDTVYNGTNFRSEYVARSSQAPEPGGDTLTILPADGWSANADPTLPSYVSMEVLAVDGAGNQTRTTFVWKLPPASTGPVSVEPPQAGDPDHFADAVDRLPKQFRSNEP